MKKIIGVYSTPAGVLVVGVTAQEVRKALRGVSGECRPRTLEQKIALTFYRTSKNFFRRGGRYKKRFTRTAKKGKTKE